jgi:hypothetical protein
VTAGLWRSGLRGATSKSERREAYGCVAASRCASLRAAEQRYCAEVARRKVRGGHAESSFPSLAASADQGRSTILRAALSLRTRPTQQPHESPRAAQHAQPTRSADVQTLTHQETCLRRPAAVLRARPARAAACCVPPLQSHGPCRNSSRPNKSAPRAARATNPRPHGTASPAALTRPPPRQSQTCSWTGSGPSRPTAGS